MQRDMVETLRLVLEGTNELYNELLTRMQEESDSSQKKMICTFLSDICLQQNLLCKQLVIEMEMEEEKEQ